MKQTVEIGAYGIWNWSHESQFLTIEADGILADLSGEWTLEAFGVLLEGLSRARLSRAIAQGEGALTCPVVLSNGRKMEMSGQFKTDGTASGVLCAAGTERGEQGAPGPALTPAFQPIVSLETGLISGFEALARWGNLQGGADSAFEDPALASNMLIKSAEALAMWREVTGRDNIFVHVNLTGRDLVGGDLPGLVEALVVGYHLPLGSLKIELTEQAALRNAAGAVAAAEALRAAGAGIVLDDFGTGHSSFAWLADIRADALKIDPSLTQRLGEPRIEIILEAITLLAQRLGMQVTAEGVENLQNVARLRTLGFLYAQGYAFAKPMFADEAVAFLRENISGMAGSRE